MSTPQGPRGMSHSRGRGNSRGAVKSRGSRFTKGENANGDYSTNNMTRGAETRRRLKPPPNQGNIRNKSWKNPSTLGAAVLSHAGRIPDPRGEAWRDPGTADSSVYKEGMNDHYQTLKQKRERERRAAIKDGFLADPDRPTSLANAITPVGTCQEMCPEFERVERIVQAMVDSNEKIPSSAGLDAKVPCEEIMVKRFRRSAAGYDEQLPSDIRPPLVLKKTLDYLFNAVVGGPEPLAKVHKYVWDRTRGIRNDFSIQQVSRLEDIKIAIDCFERIARFHILALHQLTRLDSDATEFDHHQEREQLNNTLLSLMYYYDDSRSKLISSNEAEFRAYCIIFEIQDQRPDLEDRAQIWPGPILRDPRVQTAMKLYAAAGNTSDEQGPLRPRTQFLTAQANTGGFWELVRSNAVSYIMACVAEIYFNLVRRVALEAIWKAYKGKRGGPIKMEDWTLKDLTFALGFDTEYQTQTFCEEHDFMLGEREDRQMYIDLGSVGSGVLADRNPRRKQIFSESLVESKRLGRTLPAVINGLNAAQGQSQNLVDDSSDADTASMADSESLFVNGDSDEERSFLHRSRSSSPQTEEIVNGPHPKHNASATSFNPFATTNLGPPSENVVPLATTFGQPSLKPITTQKTADSTTGFVVRSDHVSQGAFDSKETPKLNSEIIAISSKDQEIRNTRENLGKKETPSFNFFPSTIKPIITDSRVSNVLPFSATASSNGQTFGRPSSAAVSGVEPSERPVSLFGAPLSFTADGAYQQPKAALNHSQSASTPLNSFFESSPLFNVGQPDKVGKEEDLNIPSHSDSNPTPTSTASIGTKPPLSTPNFRAAISAEASRLKSPRPLEASFPSSKAAITPAIALTPQPLQISTPLTSTPLLHNDVEEVNLSSQLPLSLSSNQGQSVPKQDQHASGDKSISTLKKIDDIPSQQHQHSSNHILPRLDVRSLSLDRIAKAMVLDNKGLLEQFIEFAIGPIITSAIDQFRDERSWKEARACRTVLLGKKFFNRWRQNAWNLGLMRKAKERRKEFARSVKEPARSPARGLSSLSFSITSSAREPTSPPASRPIPAETMQPLTHLRSSRRSLPNDIDMDSKSMEIAVGSKRKYDALATNDEEKIKKPTKIGHRHSQTLGVSTMSAPPHRQYSHRPYKSRIDIAKVPEGSILYDTLRKQARRLAPIARSDTTSTDYFRLKSLGIDPDTPVIPLTKKRPWNQVDRTEPDNLLPERRSFVPTKEPLRLGLNNQTKAAVAKLPSQTTDDDEALFTQIRSVREALAESESWMHSERQSIERSMTPQTSVSPSSTETPAQRRLREIREKGYTPSRSEVRLRAMGDRAILPEGFWDGEGMGKSLIAKGNQKETEGAVFPHFSQPPQEKKFGLTGFAAVNGQRQRTGFGRKDIVDKGASADDAIEL